jgi:peptide deformylase
MRLLTYPEPFLRRKVGSIKEISQELRDSIRLMFETMYVAKGVGLAATQVEVDGAVFIMNVTGEPDGEIVFINPELVEVKGDEVDSEGCLSLPGLEAKVRRSAWAKVRALDIEGQPFEFEGEGIIARALQHELDHLAGVLFIDKIGPAARITLKSRLEEMEERYSGR